MTEYFLNEKGSSEISFPPSIKKGDKLILQPTNRYVDVHFPFGIKAIVKLYGAGSSGRGSIIEAELNILKDDIITMKAHQFQNGGGNGGSGGSGKGRYTTGNWRVTNGASGRKGAGATWWSKDGHPLLIAGGGGGSGGVGGIAYFSGNPQYTGGAGGKGGDAGEIGQNGLGGKVSYFQFRSQGGVSGSFLGSGGSGGFSRDTTGNNSSSGSTGSHGSTEYDGGGGGGGSGGISISDRYAGGGGGAGGSGGDNYIDESLLDVSTILDEFNSSDGKIEILIQEVPSKKTLIYSNGEYKRLGDSGWQAVSTDLPTAEQFQEEGMEDLSVLDRVNGYSPLDDLGDFEVVTWTDDVEADLELNINALPVGQLIFSENDLDVSLLESLSLDAQDVKVIASPNSGSTWHTFEDGAWKQVVPHKDLVKQVGMDADTINNLTIDDVKQLLNGSSTLRFAYYLEQDSIDHEVHVNSITMESKPVATETPVLESIDIEYDELTIEGRLKDLEEVNAINMNKLNFKANALMQSEKYKLHDLVVDTFEDDSMVGIEGGNPVKENTPLSEPEAFEEGYISKVSINSSKKILGLEVK